MSDRRRGSEGNLCVRSCLGRQHESGGHVRKRGAEVHATAERRSSIRATGTILLAAWHVLSAMSRSASGMRTGGRESGRSNEQRLHQKCHDDQRRDQSPAHATSLDHFEAGSHGTMPARATTWDRYDGSLPISDWQARRRRSARNLAMAAALGVLAVGLAIFIGPRLQRSPDFIVATNAGENHTVQIPDGSRVTLGGNSRIEVRLDAHTRHIELTQGEAFFAVAKDPSRPFRVHAGRATVSAVDTEFNVRQRHGLDGESRNGAGHRCDRRARSHRC
jgi:hypothetical protein